MKKKVIFMLINMNVGGTEKSLINLITEMPKEKYDITVLMLEKCGDFLNEIPNHVQIRYLDEYKNIKDMLNIPPHITVTKLLKKGQVVKAVSIAFIHLLTKIMHERSLFFNYLLKDTRKLNEEYDIAVAYAGPMDFISYFVLKKINSKRKIQWIHFDVTKIGFNKYFAAEQYNKFDKIFVVSNEGKNKLVEMVPRLKEKTKTFLNIISPELITYLANKGVGFEDDFKGYRILTVGRLSKEKGQDLTIQVLARLNKNGHPVRWYCIGDGSAKKDYERLIKEYHVENDYILLGSNPNPYPYMEQCDIYVQSSRHEGYCITLAEAKCFSNPIITTNFTGAREQIIHDQTGLIVEFDEQQIYEAIIRVLDDEMLRNKLKRNSKKKIVNTTKDLDEIYEN